MPKRGLYSLLRMTGILTLYVQLLGFVAQYGNDSTVTGPKSIVNVATMQRFKYQRFLDSQAANKEVRCVYLAFKMVC